MILSLRSLQLRQGDSFSTQDMRGDIVAKVDSRTISKIRRSDPDFNPLLLTMVESTDEKDLAQKVKNHGKGDEEDDLFDRSSDDGVEGCGEEGEEISEEEGGDSNEMKKAKLRSFDEKSKVRDAKRSEARGMKQSGDMDRELTEKDIDAI